MNEWNKIDLHIHTKEGKTYNNKREKEGTGRYYNLSNLINRNKINELKLISITNHNLLEPIEILKASYASRFSNTNALPGVELDVMIMSEKRYHIIVIFSETTDIISVSLKLDKMLSNNGNNYLTIDNLFELILRTECIIIPHACKNPHGLKATREDEVNILDAEDLINIITSSSNMNVLFEHTQPYFKESFKDSIMRQAIDMWLSESEIEELEARVETEYTASDYRFSENVIQKEKRELPEIWANPTFRGLQLSCLFHKNRLKKESIILNKPNYISKIIISGNKNFEASTINLSSGLNSIIGESASGKTALLDIITTELKGENIIEEKDYSELCKGLEVSFYNQDNFPLKKDDIKIHIAKNLYDSIKTVHDTGDNTELLKLFKFTETKNSNVLDEYESKIEKASVYYKNKVDSVNCIKENLSNIEERNKILLLNKGNVNNLLIQIPNLSIYKRLKYYQDIYQDINNYRNKIVELNGIYDTLKYKLNEVKVSHRIEEIQKELFLEINRVRNLIARQGILLKYKCKILDKLSKKFDILNNSINQKNAFISTTKSKLNSESEKLLDDIKKYYINNLKYSMLNLDFPREEINEELKKKNSHQYIEVQYGNFDEVLKLEDMNGIISMKNNARILTEFKGKVISDDNDIKQIIEILVNNNKDIFFQKNNILNSIIQKSIIKLGFPGDTKTEIKHLTPGLTAKLYIDYLFNVEIDNGANNVVVFDQPENDVDKEFIYEELITKFDAAKFHLQIIITSHEPLLVINGDTNQIIRTTRDNGMIKYESYKLEEYLDKNTVTSVIAKYVDGNVNAVKNRYEIYVGGRK